MRRHFCGGSFRSQDEAVAVEAGILMALVLLPLFLLIMTFGKFFWYYTAAQKAAHDAALFMSSAPLREIKDGGALGLADEILNAEVADMDQDTLSSMSLTTNCGYKQGNTARFIDCNAILTPAAVQAAVVLLVRNPFIIGPDSIPITAVVEMPFLGQK